jgi:aconitase A
MLRTVQEHVVCTVLGVTCHSSLSACITVADIFLTISHFLRNHQVSKWVLNFIVVSSLSSNNETGIILSVKRLMIMIMIMN